jgi:putative OPT family oligopeptide transporter
MNQQNADPLANFKPFVPDESDMKELSFKSIALGTVLGLIFGAVTVYLGLRAGLTITVNIPIAIIAIAFFALLQKMRLAKKATVLEVNTAQTVGAASESIAAGVIFTIPAMFFLGFPIDTFHVFAVALAGGLLGVAFLVPLRPYLIEKEHGVLPYPEGVACAEIIKSGEKGGSGAKLVFYGAGVGLVYKVLNSALLFWKEKPFWNPGFYKGSTLVAEVSPEMLGVGYIIGTRTANIMVAGGLLSWVVLIPMILYYKYGGVLPAEYADMSMYQFAKDIVWKEHIKYIGAGAVAAGGLINLIRALPTIVSSFRSSIRDIKRARAGEKIEKPRTRRDVSVTVVLLALGVGLVVTWLVLSLVINKGGWFGNIFSALLIAIFGFFFATVSSRLVGEIGVSSNPTSGMTIATLMATCLIFLVLGWTGGAYAAVALSVGAVVCICASNAGNVGQSLKTGFFLGCTPAKQEGAYTVGAVTSMVAVGFTLILVHQWTYKVGEQPEELLVVPEQVRVLDEYEVEGRQYDVVVITEEVAEEHAGMQPGRYLIEPESRKIYKELKGGIGSDELPAPQARIMSTVITGMLNQKLPWELIFIGIFITIFVELCGVKGLPFAVGVYLPLYTSAPIFVGGLIRWWVEGRKKKEKKSILEEESSPGILYSSGLIAGGALAGLAIVGLRGFEIEGLELGPKLLGTLADNGFWAMGFFVLLCYTLYRFSKRKPS